MEYRQFLKAAANIRPSARQLAWYDTEFYVFTHFTVNTFTDLEWGLGNEPESIFNPEKLDADQWAAAVKDMGAKAIILTAKHHDGFCLWPSAYTEHCVRNSPFRGGKGDVVREVSDACRRAGLKFGFYLSPWDRHEPTYGTDAYNDYYCAQLTELLTGYGDIFMVWLDGACGEGPNGKKQVYDFPRYRELVRKYQPNACIFYDGGPDVRWCGNEAGRTRYAEWAVIPGELGKYCEKTPVEPLMEGSLSHMYNTHENIGALENIQYAHSLAFAGGEVDMSIRPGWFWHEKEEPHSLARLYDTYLRTVGGNCCFHLNIPPNRDGLFDARDTARMHELGVAIRRSFACDMAAGLPVLREDLSPTQCTFTLDFGEEKEIGFVAAAEDIAQGQRVESFRLQFEDAAGWHDFAGGSTIGHKKICRLNFPLKTRRMRLFITGARDTVNLRSLQVYPVDPDAPFSVAGLFLPDRIAK